MNFVSPMRLSLKNILLFAAFGVAASSAQTTATYERDTTYTTFQAWTKIVKKYPQASIVYERHSDKVQVYNNERYATLKNEAGQSRDLHLDVFTPAQKGKYPALLMIHGGGWRSGHKGMERPLAQRLAEQGIVGIPVEYRLSLEAKYPEAIYDIKAAIRWVKRHADQLNVDTTRMAIEGNSAGGQLATLVGMTGYDSTFEGSEGLAGATSRVQAVVDIDGVVDFLSPASIKIPRKPDAADAFWLGGTFETVPNRWKEASPIFHIDEHAVPVLFICSGQPRFHAGRDEMIDLLTQQHIYTEVHTFADSPHSFWLLDPWFEPTLQYVLGFMRKQFNP